MQDRPVESRRLKEWTLIKMISAATVVLAVSLSQAALAGTYVVWGIGSKTCGAWTDAKRTNKERTEAYHSWIQAFVTGVAFGREGLELTQGARIEPEALISWVDAYCDANPRMTVERAAVALLEHIAVGGAK